MSSQLLIQIAQLSTILVGFLGVAVTLRSHRRQMHAQLFIEFSSRFHNVLGSMPVQVWAPGDTGEPIPPRSSELTKSCLQCFQIMASLYFLHKGGYVSRELWQPWQGGARRIMQGALMQREWSAVESAFSHNPDLCRYMQRLIQAETAISPRSAATRFKKDC